MSCVGRRGRRRLGLLDAALAVGDFGLESGEVGFVLDGSGGAIEEKRGREFRVIARRVELFAEDGVDVARAAGVVARQAGERAARLVEEPARVANSRRGRVEPGDARVLGFEPGDVNRKRLVVVLVAPARGVERAFEIKNFVL